MSHSQMHSRNYACTHASTHARTHVRTRQLRIGESSSIFYQTRTHARTRQVQIVHIAKLIDLPITTVEATLSQMILDKKFNGILDQGSGALIAYEDLPDNTTLETGLEAIDQVAHHTYTHARALARTHSHTHTCTYTNTHIRTHITSRRPLIVCL